MSAKPIAPVRGRLFSARAAAGYLGVPESRVRRFIGRGELACVRSASGRLEGIYEADCDAWIAARRQAVGAVPDARQLAADDRIKALLPRERVFS